MGREKRQGEKEESGGKGRGGNVEFHHLRITI